MCFSSERQRVKGAIRIRLASSKRPAVKGFNKDDMFKKSMVDEIVFLLFGGKLSNYKPLNRL